MWIAKEMDVKDEHSEEVESPVISMKSGFMLAKLRIPVFSFCHDFCEN